MTKKTWLDEELEREKRQKYDISFKEYFISLFKKWLKIESPSKHFLTSEPSTDNSVIPPMNSFVRVGVSAKEASENLSSLANSWSKYSAMSSIENKEI